MKCSGCYKETVSGYCLPCRKRLFDKAKVGNVLEFGAPVAANMKEYQQLSKGLSISGVQLKYSMVLNGNVLELTEKNGQYILKPIPPSRQLLNIEALPENEHLTMQIAEQVFKIKTAANALVYFKEGDHAYITRRFDVKEDGSKYLQEDFAQLTNRTKATHGDAYKYDGTYEEVGGLIKKYVAAAMPALESFFRVVVFNYVISNGDAHLKNFSLIQKSSAEYELAPAYDLVSTIIHSPTETDTALDLYSGDMEDPYYETYGCYGRPHFEELAARLGIVATRATKIIDSFIDKRDAIDDMVQQSFLKTDIKATYIKSVDDKLKRLQPVK